MFEQQKIEVKKTVTHPPNICLISIGGYIYIHIKIWLNLNNHHKNNNFDGFQFLICCQPILNRVDSQENRMISLFASPHSKGFSNQFWMMFATFWNQNSINDGEILIQELTNRFFSLLLMLKSDF